jgi:hypothetical protein
VTKAVDNFIDNIEGKSDLSSISMGQTRNLSYSRKLSFCRYAYEVYCSLHSIILYFSCYDLAKAIQFSVTLNILVFAVQTRNLSIEAIYSNVERVLYLSADVQTIYRASHVMMVPQLSIYKYIYSIFSAEV